MIYGIKFDAQTPFTYIDNMLQKKLYDIFT